MPIEPSPQRRREADGEVGAGAVGLLRRKPSVTLDQLDRYWRDVHGAIAARIPMWQGFQYHLGEPAEDLWPALGGVERDLPERVRF